MISPSAVLGRALEPSRSRVDDGDSDRTFRGIMTGYLGFLGQSQYSLKGGIWRHPRGPRHPSACREGGPRSRVAWCLPGSSPRPLWYLRSCWCQTCTCQISSNSKNVPWLTLLKEKNSRKQELALCTSTNLSKQDVNQRWSDWKKIRRLVRATSNDHNYLFVSDITCDGYYSRPSQLSYISETAKKSIWCRFNCRRLRKLSASNCVIFKTARKINRC